GPLAIGHRRQNGRPCVLEAEQLIVGHGITHWFASLPSMPPRRQAFRRGRGVLQRAHELVNSGNFGATATSKSRSVMPAPATRKIGLRLPSAVNLRSALPAFSRKVRIFSYNNFVSFRTITKYAERRSEK